MGRTVGAEAGYCQSVLALGLGGSLWGPGYAVENN